MTRWMHSAAKADNMGNPQNIVTFSCDCHLYQLSKDINRPYQKSLGILIKLFRYYADQSNNCQLFHICMPMQVFLIVTTSILILITLLLLFRMRSERLLRLCDIVLSVAT